MPGPPDTIPPRDVQVWKLRMRVGGQNFWVCHSFYGYYDRFLSGLEGSAPTVGLAFSWQIVPEVPVDPWDLPVDAIVTEEGVLRTGRAPLREPVR